MKWFYSNKSGQLIAFIAGVIVVPNILEEWISVMFQVNFENEIWYEVLDTAVMLVVGIPFMYWMLGKMDRYVSGMENLIAERRIIHDELIQTNEKLSHMAYYDKLTGLPNRDKLHLDLKENIELLRRSGTSGTLVVTLIDLDRFQQINDIMGHTIGDRVLQAIARRLLQRLPDTYRVYRYMTDGFAIIVSTDQARSSLRQDKLSFPEIIAEPFKIDAEDIYLTASCGVSVCSSQCETTEELLRQADQAVFKAKRNGGNQYQLFDPEMAEMAKRKLKLENGLQKAPEDGSLDLHYQPQIELVSGRITGVEALLRWNHPEIGPVPPNEFIPIAEETGAIHLLGEWVVKTACKQLRKWRDLGMEGITMAVNVSPLQIQRLDFCSFLADELERNGLPPKFFEVEVTESIMQDLESSERIFSELNSLGVKIAIDDFGTGYSSLSVLGTLSIDYLKIDQSFVRQMETNPKMRATVKTIVQLGENLGVELIAEGIEETRLAKELADYGCRFGQGYWFSRPVPADRITRMLQSDTAGQASALS